MANVGGHASQRDTCHLCAAYAAAYALLRRWERLRVGERSSGMASPPTLLLMRCCDAGKRRLLQGLPLGTPPLGEAGRGPTCSW